MSALHCRRIENVQEGGGGAVEITTRRISGERRVLTCQNRSVSNLDKQNGLACMMEVQGTTV